MAVAAILPVDISLALKVIEMATLAGDIGLFQGLVGYGLVIGIVS